MYLIKYEKQAVKDIKNLKGAKLDGKAKALIEILKRNPLEPPCESLVGNLSGLYSRRINIQHRLVYEIINEEVTVNSDTSEPLARKNRASLTVILSHPF